MPHIHERYDFVVSVFVVHRGRVLLLDHLRYDEWLPIGGHIELNEDPQQALVREVREESGLRLRLLTAAPRIAHPGVKPLPSPPYMDVHHIRGRHRHIALIYFATSRSLRVRLHRREHRSFRWFSERDLDDGRFGLTRSIRFYCREALRAARRGNSRALRRSGNRDVPNAIRRSRLSS